MYSRLLKGKGKGKGKDSRSNSSSSNDNNNMPRFTPGEGSGARNLSRPTRRWQLTLLEIRRDRHLIDVLFHRLQTRGEIFARLIHMRSGNGAVRGELLLQQLFNYTNHPPSSRLLPDQNTPARYHLRFINRVKQPICAEDPVTDKQGDPIAVEIYDSHTRLIIPPECFLSSAKLRIKVLDGKFRKDKGETWTRSEFNSKILKEREGKGPILTGGGLTIQLKDGKGTCGRIIFRDNSSWNHGGFCLGIMVVEVEGKANWERVQEGVSEPFRVLDRKSKGKE